MQAIPKDEEILFLPDMFLGAYVKRMTGRENIHIWMGECHVHAGIAPADVQSELTKHPAAEVLVHPECGCSTSNLYLLSEGMLPKARTHVLSTSGMLHYAQRSSAKEFIVATETGIIHQMQKLNPDKIFHAANRSAICPFMKMITLPKVLKSLQENTHVIAVSSEIRERAKLPIDRMIAIG